MPKVRKPMAYQIGRTRICEGTLDKCCRTCNRLRTQHYVGGGTKDVCTAYSVQPALSGICDLYVSKESQICPIWSKGKWY